MEEIMRFYSLAAMAASVTLMAAPVFAQNTNQSSNPNGSNQSQNSQQNGQNIRQQLVQSLEKAGFTQVRVEPEVFIVHARNEQGQPVLMRISPDTVEAVTAIPMNNQGSGQQASGNNSSSQQHASSPGRTSNHSD
jgi:Peptidase propeptide and YPEB domain